MSTATTGRNTDGTFTWPLLMLPLMTVGFLPLRIAAAIWAAAGACRRKSLQRGHALAAGDDVLHSLERGILARGRHLALETLRLESGDDPACHAVVRDTTPSTSLFALVRICSISRCAVGGSQPGVHCSATLILAPDLNRGLSTAWMPLLTACALSSVGEPLMITRRAPFFVFFAIQPASILPTVTLLNET